MKHGRDNHQNSNHQPAIQHRKYPIVLVTAATIVVIVLCWGLVALRDTTILQLHASLFALLPAAAAVVNGFLLATVIRRKKSIKGAFWFGIFLVTTTIWAIADTLTFMGTSLSAAIFLRSVIMIPALIGMPAVLLFSLIVTGEKEDELVGTWAAVYAASSLLLLVGFISDLIFDHNPLHATKVFWGYDIPLGPLGILYLLWAFTLMVMTAFVVYRHYRQQTKPDQRNQARILAIAFAIPLASAAITQIAIPAMGISILPVGSIATTTMAALVLYGMRRYNLFVIEPTTIASNIVETMAESVIVTNTKFEIEYTNSIAQQTFGLDHNSTDVERFDTRFATEEFAKVRHAILADPKMTSRKKFEDLTVMAKHSKHTASVDISISSVLDNDGNIAGYVFVMADISALKNAYAQLAHEEQQVEQKAIERNEQLFVEHAKLEASIASLPMGFAMLDERNKILELNGVAKHLLKLQGNTTKHLLHAFERLQILKQLEQVQSDYTMVDIAELHFEKNILHVVIAPILSSKSEALGTVILIEDITKQKIAERERNEFIVTASHEMRTPLTVVQGNLANALDPDIAKLGKDVKPLIEQAYSSTGQLAELFKDIMTVSEIDNGSTPHYENKTAFVLSELVADCIQQLRPKADAKKIALSFHSSSEKASIHADPNEVKDILSKLIENAIKYTTKGYVSVTLKQEKHHVIVTIEDSGVGIPQEDRKRLFKKFARLDNRLTREIGGTGLGLYIAQSLAERNHGKVTLEHSSAKGSMFSLELPLE